MPSPHLLLLTVPVVKATWEKDAEFVEFYSDVTDASIPTVTLGVANTERGDQRQGFPPAAVLQQGQLRRTEDAWTLSERVTQGCYLEP